jgi:hypothetical protein
MRVVGTLDPAQIARGEPATRLGSLDQAITAGLDILDVVVQDEYTHDIVAMCNGVVVVLDTT